MVFNLLNTQNVADKRVYEILSNKFELFKGVFGASDRAIGLLESGADFEKRVSHIYQECKTSKDFTKEFTSLERELDRKRNKKMEQLKSLIIREAPEQHKETFEKILSDIQTYQEQLDYWEKAELSHKQVIYPLFYELKNGLNIPGIEHGYLLIGGYYAGEELIQSVFQISDEKGKIYAAKDELIRILTSSLTDDNLIEESPDNVAGIIKDVDEYLFQEHADKCKILISQNDERIENWTNLRKEEFILSICDYNVPYEITLKEAINKGALVPFHYYGIYDETDYSTLKLVKGRYNENDLNDKYIGNVKRYDLIYKYYKKYHSKRALGFCSSRMHAEEMAKEFCRRGVKSVAVYSNADGEFSEERNVAIEQLKNQEIKVIFSVDMFNEGVDIASLDMVMFLRPTESPTVFLQQLGRGLRISKGKEYVNVLDFIGNYEKAGRAPFLLNGGACAGERTAYDYSEIEYPDDCIVDFDMHLIDLFREMDEKSLSIKERIKQEYYRVKELLDGKVPTRTELFTNMDDHIYEYCMKHSKENPFKRYMDFLYEIHELSDEELQVYNGIGKEFLQLIETTDMQKVYKMPILYGFYNDGNVRLAVTDEEVVESWKRFFNRGTNWKDFPQVTSYEEYRKITDKQHLSKAKSMPIKFLKASGKGFFIDKDGYALGIRDELADVIKVDAFKKQMKDIIEYRTMEYYRRRYVEK